jgi:hypothetical protein
MQRWGYFSGQTGVSIDDDDTTYVWIDDSNFLQTGAALPGDVTAHVPLAEVVAAGGVMTITDLRGYARDTVAHGDAGKKNLESEVEGVLSIANGGTGADNAVTARVNLTVAKSGANSDITSLAGLTTPLSVAQGGSGAATVTGVVHGNGAAAMTAGNVDLELLPAVKKRGNPAVVRSESACRPVAGAGVV